MTWFEAVLGQYNPYRLVFFDFSHSSIASNRGGIGVKISMRFAGNGGGDACKKAMHKK